ncbi:carbohydrate-binding protein [Paucibacter sp. TC2R-5]|uniref:GH36-type glycosyl hydrolase domain-containing protein n=1 Tax=Paucibacter sp. TC2R-5 TaxID=2893555 RepID=UPI0021E4A6C6|nr:glucoamylase family protein [Paucibacter sp. TC2R-5]MCV2360559.1 carbohydrate-binding protein [Paucibacter sp. TC2R-5]
MGSSERPQGRSIAAPAAPRGGRETFGAAAFPRELQRLLPEASPLLCDILGSQHGALQAPIRAEIFGQQRFAQHGRSLGATHSAERASAFAASFFPRLRSNVQALRQAHRYIGERAKSGYDISPAAEWLLDNFHLVEAQLKEVHEGLPRSYFRALPVLVDEPLAGLPRIYGVAWAFVAHTDGAFDEDLLLQFLSAYQETRELSLREIWALPTTLRVVLVENLRRLAERVATNKAAREVANLCFDRLDSFTTGALEDLLALLNRRGVGRIFLAQMAQRLQDQRMTGERLSDSWRARWLSEALPDLAAAQLQQTADQTADNLSVSNALTSLRAIGDADWPDIVARSSSLMHVMMGSPVFAAEHMVSRDQSLHAIERLARRSGRSEVAVAQALLGLMDVSHGAIDAKDKVAGQAHASKTDASHWLSGAGRPALWAALGLPGRQIGLLQRYTRRLALPFYLCALLCGSIGLVAWGLPAQATWPLVALLMLFPASEAVVAVINRLVSESARPSLLPRLALAQGIPPEHRVMVVMPAMLSSAAAVAELVHRLHLHYLANPEPQAQFALLSDWLDAPTPELAGDAALLALAQSQLSKLNLRHPQLSEQRAPRFILLHRRRAFSPTEQAWIGWERKRGKLEQLITLLAEPGGESSFVDLGELSTPMQNTRYIVTLDSDTQLPPGRLRELVGVAAHPHNQPRLDPSGRFVAQGYGILQPRVVTPLPAPKDFTLYHWFFAGQCGIDPYSAASSEVYQDLFQEGSFSGKGLLHVQALHAVLHARLPEGQVLSHDLLEGALARCAAVSDITVVEDAPFHADVAASRVHRWTRGDWQLLPILLNPWRYPFRAVSRWKMFDNLRRSLVAPASMALLVFSLAGSGVPIWVALGLVWAALAAGPLLGALAGFAPSRDDLALRHFYGRAGSDLLRALLSGAWLLGQLMQQALMALDAVARALFRMFISRRRLLQWTTAAAAQAAAKTALPAVLRQHWRAPLLALLLFVGLLYTGTEHPLLAALLCGAWLTAPLLSWWVSRPNLACEQPVLLAAEQIYLHGVARDTWRFFERCIGPGDRYLPPDNFQTDPQDMLAHRTSPTNIGLYLLAVPCAREFGWIGTQELLSRLEATLASLAALERHRGHFLNWYDTERGAALLPRYVSTVDSGNLCGHLLAAAQACRKLAQAPFDTEAGARAQRIAQERLAPLLTSRCGAGAPVREQLRWCLADLRATRRSAALDLVAAEQPAAIGRLLALAGAFERLAMEADFKFLYHPKRHLFHIGYRVAEQQLDSGFYDLLASESRLTSLFAVAKGDVPVRHWCALGRPFFAVEKVAGLRSWSGSMFEYLMPSLVLDEPHGSVLREACLAALQEQVRFAAQNQTPWGISESAIAGRDYTLAYQYAPQGVPRLALRRTPSDELVIAPYATALAAQIAPQAACRNFAVLEGLSPAVRGRYGFIEALDYSPARQAGKARFTPVSTFMAHHQGMSVVALANVLLGGVAQRWGMAPAQIEAVASLLHERAPREVPVLFEPPQGWVQPTRELRAPSLLREVLPGETAVAPTHLLSNGRYSVSLRANGAGWSRWGRVGISRWRDDALRDALGSFFYLRGLTPSAGPGLVSLTQHPAPDPAAQYRSTFHADTVCFEATWPQLQAKLTVWVSPEDDIEFRQVELRNLSERTLNFELISAFEPTLAEPRADEAHPAFSKLFLRAEWQAEDQALLFERKPRLDTEQGVLAAHFLADGGPHLLGLRCQTDRHQWLGRNRQAGRPLADFETPLDADDSAEPGMPAEQDTGLDPVCALAARIHIAPQAKVVLTFATAACDSRAKLDAIIDKYRQPSHVQRATLMSATLTCIRLRTLGLSAENLAALQSVTTALLLSLARPQAATPDDGDPALLEATAVCDRRVLWRFGISGDKPLILVSAGVLQGLGLLRTLAKALRLWSWGGVACDLVIINGEPASYLMTLQRELLALRERHLAENQAGAASGQDLSGLHVLRAEELSPSELSSLRTLACLRLHADGRPLPHHIADWLGQHEQALDARLEASSTVVGPELGPHVQTSAQQFQGKFGGAATPELGEFSFEVDAQRKPQRPWINVLANRDFGAQLSESGGGYSWALNSRMNQLTPWANDAVADPPGEWFLLQDMATLAVWSVAPGAWGEAELGYEVRHGQGYSVIKHRRGDLGVTATWCVDAATSVKQIELSFVNHGSRSLTLRVLGMVEWQMGAGRAERSTLQTLAKPTRASDRRLNTLLATQREQGQGFGEGTAFFALAAPTEPAGKHGPAAESVDWTCDRREFFDARGRLVMPDFLGKRDGAGLDPCAALATELQLAPGASAQRVFLLGYGASPAAALALAEQAAGVPAAQRLGATQASWDALLGTTELATPDPLFDALVNRWLLYQTVACRLWAKAGFYQAGGATGFRDQLQDAMALAWAAPQLLRQQIVLCASRQFVEGDVQHWWHSPLGAGVRTHFSDDLLWLPLACAHYLRCTGDAGLLDEGVHFLDGAQIPAGAEDAYYTPTQSAEAASVYEHAARTLDRSLRVGVHGLPLMGSGDWNDGMNRVGAEGRGESVWLGWFLCRVVTDFAPLARARGESFRAATWESAAAGWRSALIGPAWDGQWFKRAFFDNGEPLGSSQNAEARIDLIAQAWSVLSGAAPPALQRMAMAAAQSHLIDADAGLLRLLDPPLAKAVPSAGYIQAYPPGVRENGGQYSHAGVWALMARAQLGQGAAERADGPEGEAAGDAVYRYFSYLSPAHRAAHPQRGPVYGAEPYVLAGDVYSQPPYVGRGGWSWYTGAAAWLHRAAIESICGLRLEASQLSFQPCLPGHWPRVELTLRRDGRVMHFVLLRCNFAQALAKASSLGAQVLLPGESLAWSDLPANAVPSNFVVPLVPAAAHSPARPSPTAAGVAL